MKKVLVAVALLLIGVTAFGLNIDYIQIQQSSGVSADYNAGTHGLGWSGGSFSYIYTEAGEFAAFEKSNVSAAFNLFSDDSVGGEAKARFGLVGNWSVSLYELATDVNPVIVLTGTLNNGGGFDGKYWEEETAGSVLDGRAWVNLNGMVVDPTWYQTNVIGKGYDGLSWDDNVAGLDSDIIIPGSIEDYQSSYASANGVSITLWADQSQIVPEPATMAILGLGGLALLRKRK